MVRDGYDMWLMKVRLCGCALYHNEGLEFVGWAYDLMIF